MKALWARIRCFFGHKWVDVDMWGNNGFEIEYVKFQCVHCKQEREWKIGAL